MDYDFDVVRILLGEGDTVSALFYLEVVFRTTVMYIYMIVFARIVGQGAIGQIGPFEFVLVIALGSAAGDPMFYPDIGLMQGIVVITVVILLHRFMGYILTRSHRAEMIVEGVPIEVVRDGKVIEEALGSGSLSRRELFALLRREGVRNTGEIECAFFETNGHLSVFRQPEGKAVEGISTMPAPEEARITDSGNRRTSA